jgi:hypothetical protein
MLLRSLLWFALAAEVACARNKVIKDAHCHPSTRQRGRGVLLTYTFGSMKEFTLDLCGIFLRSFVAVGSNDTDLVILHETPGAPPCAGYALPPGRVRIVAVPPELLKVWQEGKTKALLYRYQAFDWFLAQQTGYAYVGVLDADIIFQRDIFDVLFRERDAAASELHFVLENSAERNKHFIVPHEKKLWWGKLPHGHCKHMPVSMHRLGVIGHMPALAERNSSHAYWSVFGEAELINCGTVFGTTGAMRELLRRMSTALRSDLLHNCWEQAVFLVLAWSGALAANATNILWPHTTGVVETCDTGGMRDSRGRFINELGGEFAMVHMFKRNRNRPLIEELERMLPAPPRAVWQEQIFPKPLQRVRLVDTRYKHGLHPRTAMMAKANMPDPGSPSVPLPKFSECGARYEAAGAIGPTGIEFGETWHLLHRKGFLAGVPSGPVSLRSAAGVQARDRRSRR